jgi:heat shock protein HslJ
LGAGGRWFESSRPDQFPAGLTLSLSKGRSDQFSPPAVGGPTIVARHPWPATLDREGPTMTICTVVFRGVSVLLAGVLLSACQSRPDDAAPKAASLMKQAPATDRSAPTLEELRNATYRGVEEAGGEFALVSGRWEGRPFAPGGASRPSVTFVRDFRLTGDLDGDGGEEAVVLLAAAAGGTGEMSYLAVVGRTGGSVANAATAPIGDRVQVRGARIDGQRIVLDVVQAGESDAACCPGDLVTRTWERAGDALKEASPVKTGRLSLDALAGTEWVLKAWAWDEAAPAAPDVTLKVDGTRLTGNAGCNGYFAPVTPGGSPGDITIGPAGSTRMMCPEAEMAVEQRFLEQLAGVTQIRFVAGQLALRFAKRDNAIGVMLFDRRAAR